MKAKASTLKSQPKEYIDALNSMLGQGYDQKSIKTLQPPDFYEKPSHLLSVDENNIIEEYRKRKAELEVLLQILQLTILSLKILKKELHIKMN